MKVLITGGMGVIGAEASRKFVREGHRPVVFARHRDDRLVGDIVEGIDFEAGDILDMPRLLGVIKAHHVTHIVHSAAFVGAVSAANPALSIQVNVIGTVNVLEAARLFDVRRVVYTSAKGIYGHILGAYGPPSYKPMPEEQTCRPHAQPAAHAGFDFAAMPTTTSRGSSNTNATHRPMPAVTCGLPPDPSAVASPGAATPALPVTIV